MRSSALLTACLFSLACSRHALRPADPGRTLEFPRDDAAHAEAQTEFFHWHGHVADAQGRRYDFFLGTIRQHTDFDRVAIVPVRFFVDPFYDSFFAFTDRAAGRYQFRSKRAFPDLWTASASEERLSVRHGSWRVEASPGGMEVAAGAPDGKVKLRLSPQKRPSLRGGNGFYAIPPASSNHYYSYTRLAAEGEVVVDGETRPVTGAAWFKHMWGPLYDDDVRGWAWFAVQLDGGAELEMALVFDRDWTMRPESFASLVEEGGSARDLTLSQVGVHETGATWHSPRSGATWPVGWAIDIPERGRLELSTTVPAQEIVSFPAPFWVGTLEATGTFDGKDVRGDAFAELVGWADPVGRFLYVTGKP
jgi:predicted secreted hydrolase